MAAVPVEDEQLLARRRTGSRTRRRPAPASAARPRAAARCRCPARRTRRRSRRAAPAGSRGGRAAPAPLSPLSPGLRAMPATVAITPVGETARTTKLLGVGDQDAAVLADRDRRRTVQARLRWPARSSPENPASPVPATVVTEPSGRSSRTRWLPVSATSTAPSSRSATSRGAFRPPRSACRCRARWRSRRRCRSAAARARRGRAPTASRRR